MSEKRIPSSQRKARPTADVNLSKTASDKFIGVSLSGGKSDKACLALVEYFPDQKKIFLSKLIEKIKTEEMISADLKIIEMINQFKNDLKTIAFDVPLSLPTCITCQLKCPGYELCGEDEMKWMRQLYAKINMKKKPKKMFTPYTQRCTEAYIANELEETFEIHHALGSNSAPLTARALFLQRRLDHACIEVFPKLAVWRLGQMLRISKSHIKFHRHSNGGDVSRKIFIEALAEKFSLFIYEQDKKSMIENNHAFEAFICAFVGYLKLQGKNEKRPAGFPKKQVWIEFPTGLKT